jgi:hypothetical protein
LRQTAVVGEYEDENIYFQEIGYPRCIAYPSSKNSIYIKEANYRIRFEISEGEDPRYTGFLGYFW